jgi:hypothetical protein
MAVTATPVFPQVFNAGVMNVLLSTAMTNTKAFEGTDASGAAIQKVFTAGANGSLVRQARVQYASTTAAAPSGTSTATTIRIFVNNGGVNTTVTNNAFIGEISMPAVAFTNAVPMGTLILQLDIYIPASYTIWAGMSAAIGATNWAAAVTCFGGDY